MCAMLFNLQTATQNLVIISRPTEVYREYSAVHDLIYRVNKIAIILLLLCVCNQNRLYGGSDVMR